ncbi:hypothetical protein BC828DRAFT_160232 [Blastocladiella britannica]|nr:hypothetical protein BC828DRAFT_160232 [Blastocladiella britannica]
MTKAILRFESVSDVTDAEWSVVAPIAGKPVADRRKVLFAYDASASGDYAVQWLFENILRDNEDHLILLTAVEQASPLMRFNLRSSEEEIRQQIKERYAKMQAIHNTLSAMAHHRNISTQSFLLEGDPREVIVDVAEKTRTDIIVMGARGLNAVHRALLGSASQYVTVQAPMPVVVVKTPANYVPEVLPLERVDTKGSVIDWLSLKETSIVKHLRALRD